jgi:hypothetical protein
MTTHILRIDAHCMDVEMEALFLRNYDVRIAERHNAPWEWAFVGTRQNLAQMVTDHWGYPEDELPGVLDLIKEQT